VARNPSDRDLAPLSADLPPEVRELAEFLRVRFQRLQQLGVSVRTYAPGTNYDAGTVSRFLSGQRIPPKPFVDELLADAEPQRSLAQVRDDRAQVYDLRIKALQVRNARAAESERLAEELSEAEEEISLLKTKERALAKALLHAEDDYSSLWEKYQQMQATRAKGGPLQIEGNQGLEQLAQERDHAKDEVQRLERELSEERSARVDAEKRRDALLAQLEMADYKLIRAGGAVLVPNGYDTRIQLIAALRDRRTRWGSVTSLVAVPVVIYGIPIYLGLIYHLLTGSQEVLKILTMCGLLIPLWFAVGVRRTKVQAFRGNLWYFLLLMIVTAATFLVTAQILLKTDGRDNGTFTSQAARPRAQFCVRPLVGQPSSRQMRTLPPRQSRTIRRPGSSGIAKT
jgi:hypothetical protein